MDRKTFLKTQKRAAKLFQDSIKKDRLAQAYLFYGETTSPLKQACVFIAKSLWCSNPIENLACEQCESCIRFQDKIRPDFMEIDGEDKIIKKDQIKEVQDRLTKTNIEKNHRTILLINKIDNITDKAANALLKSLEEPQGEEIFLLTTYNLDKVLPTILSRCVTVRIDPLSKKQTIDDLLANPIYIEDEKNGEIKQTIIDLSYCQCYFLTSLYSSRLEMASILEKDNSFKDASDIAEQFINDLATSLNKAGYTLLKESINKRDTKCYNYVYLILHNVFSSILLDDIDESFPFMDILDDLKSKRNVIYNCDLVLKDILQNQIYNFNKSLCASRIAESLIKDV